MDPDGTVRDFEAATDAFNFATFPHWKFYLSADYETDNWSVGTTVRVESEVDDINPSPNDLATHVDNIWYQDLCGSHSFWENVTIDRLLYGSVTLSF